MASAVLITKETALEAVITTVLKTSEAGRVLGTELWLGHRVTADAGGAAGCVA